MVSWQLCSCSNSENSVKGRILTSARKEREVLVNREIWRLAPSAHWMAMPSAPQDLSPVIVTPIRASSLVAVGSGSNLVSAEFCWVSPEYQPLSTVPKLLLSGYQSPWGAHCAYIYKSTVLMSRTSKFISLKLILSLTRCPSACPLFKTRIVHVSCCLPVRCSDNMTMMAEDWLKSENSSLCTGIYYDAWSTRFVSMGLRLGKFRL